MFTISNSPEDDAEDLITTEATIPPALQKTQLEQIRKMSLVGHAFQSIPTNLPAAQHYANPVREVFWL